MRVLRSTSAIRRRLPLLLFILPLFWSFATGFAAEPADRILAVDEQRVQAMIRSDVQGLAKLLSDSLSYGHSDGRVQSKQQLLSALASNRIQYLSYRYSERNVLMLGDARGLTGTAAIRVSSQGAPLEFSIRFLAVYVQEDGAWRLAAYQSTQTPASTP